jgi:hypothetical protein
MIVILQGVLIVASHLDVEMRKDGDGHGEL